MMELFRGKIAEQIRQSSKKGFILPVVIVLSLGISAMSITALQTVSSSSNSLNEQYYQTLAKEAAQAGIRAGASCLKSGESAWTDSARLTPKTNCQGVENTTGQSYVSKNDNWESTFSVKGPVTSSTTVTLTAIGTVTLRATNGAILKTFTESAKSISKLGGRTSKSASDISAGQGHVCTVAEQRAYCWGWNQHGQLGDGSNTNRNSPVLVSENTTPIPAVPSVPNPCGGGWPQPACTTPAKPAVPASAMVGKNVSAIAAGFNHTCAIAEGTVYCWGNNDSGQLGNNTTVSSTAPVSVYMNTVGTPAIPAQPAGCGSIWSPCTTPAVPAVSPSILHDKTVTSISAGDRYTCAVAHPKSGTINDSRAYCWGLNSDGQLGVNDKVNRLVPTPVYAAGATPAQPALPAGCGAWNNPCTTAAQPAQAASVLYGKTITQITSGDEHTCVVTSEGAGACWGQDTSGQIGSGQTRSTTKGTSPGLSCNTTTTTTRGTDPSDIPDVIAPKLVHVNQSYSYTDIFGTRTIPASPLYGKKIISINASGSYTNALADDGRVYWWGGKKPDRQYNMDQGFITCRNRKTSSPPCARGESSCYVNEREYHQVSWYTWDFDIHDKPIGPVYQEQTTCWWFFTCKANNLLTNKQLKMISGSVNLGTFCAIDMAGSAYCDGPPYNPYYGQLGEGTFPVGSRVGNIFESDPKRVDQNRALAGKTITKIVAGAYGNFTCVIANEVVYCWGVNDVGEIGDGTTGLNQSKNTPTAVDISGPLGRPGGANFSEPIIF